MADSSGSGSNLPVIALMAVAVLTGGFFYYRGPLKPTRPGDTPERAPEQFQQVHARLWEDPLLVMHRHREWERKVLDGEEALDAHGIPALWDAIEDPEEHSTLLVLPILIAGGPYAEDHESRLRTRYAVLSALGARGFIPQNAAELPYLLWEGTGSCWPQGRSCQGIPYEWWTRPAGRPGREADGEPARAVLVLWLKDDAFGDAPFHKLQELDEHLFPQDRTTAGGTGRFTGIETRLIGPRTSDGLFAMLRETNCTEQPPPEARPLSPWATYPFEAMAADLRVLPCPRLAEGTAVEPVERTILDDGVLLKSLLTELRLRRAPWPPQDERGALVVIVSEWDTLYGRRMLRTLEKVRDSLKQPGCEEPGPGVATPCDPWEQIIPITYQRGLDGRLPGEAGPRTPARADDEAGDELEQPVGRGRLDYALRLATAIETRFRGREVAAIGVLGSDFYDKILILQALRPRFSRSLFFTTDLDARYLQSTHLPWSRNLLVASSFGLTLRPDETHPPFRDAYQTSMYRATLRALGEEPHDVDLQAKVYEIGRTKPVLVMEGTGDAVSGPVVRHRVGVAILSLFALAVVLWVVHLTAGLHSVPWRVLALAILLPAGIYGLLFLLLNRSLGFMEPFLLLEGVSLWPTEILRVIALCLSLLLLIVSVGYLSDRNEKTATLFGFGTTGRPGWKVREMFVLMSRVSRKSATELWHEYADRTGGRYCAVHVAVMCLLYFGLGFSLMTLGPAPMVPFRGLASFWFDQAALMPGVIAMILLIMYVLYQTLLCRSWVHALVRVDDWPASRIGTQGPFDSTGYRAIRLVARQTRIIGRITYYPFVILFLMILSRSTYFDRWDWPVPLLILLGLNSGYLLGCAFVLRWEAEKLRRRAVRNLQAKRIAAVGVDDETAKRTGALIDSIQALQEGAFAPLSRHPVFGAFLWPVGGVGILALFDQIMRAT